MYSSCLFAKHLLKSPTGSANPHLLNFIKIFFFFLPSNKKDNYLEHDGRCTCVAVQPGCGKPGLYVETVGRMRRYVQWPGFLRISSEHRPSGRPVPQHHGGLGAWARSSLRCVVCYASPLTAHGPCSLAKERRVLIDLICCVRFPCTSCTGAGGCRAVYFRSYPNGK